MHLHLALYVLQHNYTWSIQHCNKTRLYMPIHTGPKEPNILQWQRPWSMGGKVCVWFLLPVFIAVIVCGGSYMLLGSVLDGRSTGRS